MDAGTGILGEVAFWLDGASSWSCTCRNRYACDVCHLRGALAASAAAIGQRRWSAAHRAASRAAQIDGRLAAVAQRLDSPAFLEREGRMARDTMYRCGRTHAGHHELLADVILREEALSTGAMVLAGQFHEDDDVAGIHLHAQQVTCVGCTSSFIYRLPGDDGVTEIDAAVAS